MKRSSLGARIGFIGGAIGVILGVIYFLAASILTVVQLFHHVPVGSFIQGVLGVIFGIFAIVGAGTARRDSAMGAVLLIVAAILGFYFIDSLYVISSVIVLIAGIVAIVDYAK